MRLPPKMPYPPMEALSASGIPEGPDWQYEPKWDGFRCVVFRDGSELELQSKAGQPLSRYFPELVAGLLHSRARKFVLDGEIIVPVNGRLSFDDLLLRIHPAQSRVHKLAQERPALLIAFDLLVDNRGNSLVEYPLEERRRALESFAAKYFDKGVVRLSPATSDLREARRWFEAMGGGLDGIIAKRRDLPYQPGERTGAMQKIKNMRSADCVVGGFRYAEKAPLVGSLLLGLYDDDGLLHHVGFTSSIHKADRQKITGKLERLIKPPGFSGRAPGGPSRWSTARSAEWRPLDPKLVAEVQYDHFSGGRFRHGMKFLRWRPDKAPRQCTMAQVEHESQSPLGLL